ncbi:MAG: efflux RND transporter periplasmic adaptor subunit [Sulfuricella sp.]|nr:efflux RND transporter periplasmic adaptor subunit [Sulfuricella sp.]
MKKWLWAGVCCVAATGAWAADVAATLQWSQRVELSPRVSGIVREVRVQAGDRVKKGQVLVALDAAVYEAKVAESRAAVARFTEETAEAQRDLGRTQELYDRTVIATSELDQAKLRQARAKAQLDGARARLARERTDLADSQLRAPFDAVVVARLTEPGHSVAVGLQPQPLLVLAKAGEMAARFRLPADRVGSVKPGQTVTVKIGRQEYPATLKAPGLEPMAGKDGPAYEVDALFAVKELLRAGTAAVVKLPE